MGCQDAVSLLGIAVPKYLFDGKADKVGNGPLDFLIGPRPDILDSGEGYPVALGYAFKRHVLAAHVGKDRVTVPFLGFCHRVLREGRMLAHPLFVGRWCAIVAGTFRRLR